MNTTPLNILHVEDDIDLQHYLAAVLSDVANITPATSLEEARACIAGTVYDLVILDLTLPDGSGTTLVSELAAQHPTVPIIVLSAHDISRSMVNVNHVYTKGRFMDQDLVDTVLRLTSQP